MKALLSALALLTTCTPVPAMAQEAPVCEEQSFFRSVDRIYVGCEVALGQYLVFDLAERIVHVIEIVPEPEVISSGHEDFASLQHLYVSAGTFGAMQGAVQGYRQGFTNGRAHERRVQEQSTPVCHRISLGEEL